MNKLHCRSKQRSSDRATIKQACLKSGDVQHAAGCRQALMGGTIGIYSAAPRYHPVPHPHSTRALTQQIRQRRQGRRLQDTAPLRAAAARLRRRCHVIPPTTLLAGPAAGPLTVPTSRLQECGSV